MNRKEIKEVTICIASFALMVVAIVKSPAIFAFFGV